MCLHGDIHGGSPRPSGHRRLRQTCLDGFKDSQRILAQEPSNAQGPTQFAPNLHLRTAQWGQTIVLMVSAFSCSRPESSPTLFWTTDRRSGWPIDRQSAIYNAFASQPNSQYRIRWPTPPLCGLPSGQNQSMVLGCHLEFYCDGACRCI